MPTAITCYNHVKNTFGRYRDVATFQHNNDYCRTGHFRGHNIFADFADFAKTARISCPRIRFYGLFCSESIVNC